MLPIFVWGCTLLELVLSDFRKTLGSLVCPTEMVGDSNFGLRRLHNEDVARVPYGTLQVTALRISDDSYNKSSAYRGVAGGNLRKSPQVQFDRVVPMEADITFTYRTTDLSSIFSTIKLILFRTTGGEFNRTITVDTLSTDTSFKLASDSIGFGDPDDNGIIDVPFEFTVKSCLIEEGSIAAVTSIVPTKVNTF